MSEGSWKTYFAQHEEVFGQVTLLEAEDQGLRIASGARVHDLVAKCHALGWGDPSLGGRRSVTKIIVKALAELCADRPSELYGQLILITTPPANQPKPADSQSEAGSPLSQSRWEWPTVEPEAHLIDHREEPEQPDPDALLAALADGDAPREQVRKSVLDAEVLAFHAEQIDRLKPLLRQYIERYRDSNDPADIVAVASAIRTYVAYLGQSELATLGFVLDAGHRAPVPLEIELEVAKMVVRKLSANPPQEADAMPELSNQLMDLARTYLTPRLLPRQYYAAAALNSVLALVLLRSSHVGDLHGILRQLEVPWFTDLTARRAERIEQDLAERFPGEESRVHREGLEALVHTIRDAAQ